MEAIGSKSDINEICYEKADQICKKYSERMTKKITEYLNTKNNAAESSQEDSVRQEVYRGLKQIVKSSVVYEIIAQNIFPSRPHRSLQLENIHALVRARAPYYWREEMIDRGGKPRTRSGSPTIHQMNEVRDEAKRLRRMTRRELKKAGAVDSTSDLGDRQENQHGEKTGESAIPNQPPLEQNETTKNSEVDQPVVKKKTSLGRRRKTARLRRLMETLAEKKASMSSDNQVTSTITSGSSSVYKEFDQKTNVLQQLANSLAQKIKMDVSTNDQVGSSNCPSTSETSAETLNEYKEVLQRIQTLQETAKSLALKEKISNMTNINVYKKVNTEGKLP